jgi:fructose-1,6-bisphosphatase I
MASEENEYIPGVIYRQYIRSTIAGWPADIDYNLPLVQFSLFTGAEPMAPGTLGLPAARRHLVASGYIIYGVSTMLVYTTGTGVHFTRAQSLAFCFTQHRIQPSRSTTA